MNIIRYTKSLKIVCVYIYECMCVCVDAQVILLTWQKGMYEFIAFYNFRRDGRNLEVFCNSKMLFSAPLSMAQLDLSIVEFFGLV